MAAGGRHRHDRYEFGGPAGGLHRHSRYEFAGPSAQSMLGQL